MEETSEERTDQGVSQEPGEEPSAGKVDHRKSLQVFPSPFVKNMCFSLNGECFCILQIRETGVLTNSKLL